MRKRPKRECVIVASPSAPAVSSSILWVNLGSATASVLYQFDCRCVLVTHLLAFSLHLTCIPIFFYLLGYCFCCFLFFFFHSRRHHRRCFGCADCLCFGFCAKVAATPSVFVCNRSMPNILNCMGVAHSILFSLPHRIVDIMHSNERAKQGRTYKAWSLHIRIHARAYVLMQNNVWRNGVRTQRYGGPQINLKMEMQLYKFFEWRQTTNPTVRVIALSPYISTCVRSTVANFCVCTQFFLRCKIYQFSTFKFQINLYRFNEIHLSSVQWVRVRLCVSERVLITHAWHEISRINLISAKARTNTI